MEIYSSDNIKYIVPLDNELAGCGYLALTGPNCQLESGLIEFLLTTRFADPTPQNLETWRNYVAQALPLGLREVILLFYQHLVDHEIPITPHDIELFRTLGFDISRLTDKIVARFCIDGNDLNMLSEIVRLRYAESLIAFHQVTNIPCQLRAACACKYLTAQFLPNLLDFYHPIEILLHCTHSQDNELLDSVLAKAALDDANSEYICEKFCMAGNLYQVKKMDNKTVLWRANWGKMMKMATKSANVELFEYVCCSCPYERVGDQLINVADTNQTLSLWRIFKMAALSGKKEMFEHISAKFSDYHPVVGSLFTSVVLSDDLEFIKYFIAKYESHIQERTRYLNIMIRRAIYVSDYEKLMAFIDWGKTWARIPESDMPADTDPVYFDHVDDEFEDGLSCHLLMGTVNDIIHFACETAVYDCRAEIASRLIDNYGVKIVNRQQIERAMSFPPLFFKIYDTSIRDNEGMIWILGEYIASNDIDIEITKTVITRQIELGGYTSLSWNRKEDDIMQLVEYYDEMCSVETQKHVSRRCAEKLVRNIIKQAIKRGYSQIFPWMAKHDRWIEAEHVCSAIAVGDTSMLESFLKLKRYNSRVDAKKLMIAAIDAGACRAVKILMENLCAVYKGDKFYANYALCRWRLEIYNYLKCFL